jgi:hypothetical protein
MTELSDPFPPCWYCGSTYHLTHEHHRVGELVVHCKVKPYDVYIGRPSMYGNPYSHLKDSAAKFMVATREEAIAKYEAWLRARPEMVSRVKEELKGKVLGCWCWPKLCHGEVLVKIANEP